MSLKVEQIDPSWTSNPYIYVFGMIRVATLPSIESQPFLPPPFGFKVLPDLSRPPLFREILELPQNYPQS
jgi:hypothetical protein